MSISEKIDFLHMVHREEISLWDEDGNDNEIWEDYHTVQEELLHHPEMLNCDDLLHIMKIFDDDCFEITWQYNLARMVTDNCVFLWEKQNCVLFAAFTGNSIKRKISWLAFSNAVAYGGEDLFRLKRRNTGTGCGD